MFKATHAEIKYDILWAYTNHSISKIFDVNPPHKSIEQITIRRNRSKTDIILSSKNGCKLYM